MRTAIISVLGLSCLATVPAAEFSVHNAAELAPALARLNPGDVLILADGTWRDTRLELTRAGTAEAPITIRAQTPGRVILTGDSSLTFAASHVTVAGLLFTEGTTRRDSVVTFAADHGRLTDSAIIDFNPPDVATSYYWVYFDGSYNRLDHCFFKGKNHQQPLIGNDRTDSRHNAVDHCHFKDIPFVPHRNGREILRIWGYGGNEEMGDDGAFFTIEHNRFEQADGEGMEIISLKSNRNLVRHNTILRTRGGITNRSGNYNTITDNVILCDGYDGAYGMRVTGQYHTIARNYIRGGEFGLHLMAGEFINHDLTGRYEPIKREGTPLGRVPAYQQPKHTVVAENILVNNAGSDLYLGNGYKSGWPKAQRVLLPELNRLTGNRILKPGGGIAIDAPKPDTAAPLDTFVFAANAFEDNVVAGGSVGLSPAPEGIAVKPTPDRLPAPPRVLTPADVGPAWIRQDS